MVLVKKQKGGTQIMVDKQIDKYNELEIEYFSNGTPWTYEWEFEGKPSLLDWNYELKRYEYWQGKTLLGTFPDVYAALDGIILGKKTLRQMLLETDFDFNSIL